MALSKPFIQTRRNPSLEAVRPLRVGFYLFFPGGGIGRYTHRLMEVMNARDGVHVEAICTPDFEWADAEAYSAWTGLQSISHEVPTVRRWRFLKGQFVNPRRAIEHAVSQGIDVLHLANINHLTFPYWRTAAQEADVKIVASAHDVKRQKRIISRMWEDQQLKAFYRFADALFVHSVYQADELVAFAGVPRERIHVVPHGLYEHSARPQARQSQIRMALGLPSEPSIGLFFGQIRDEKNLEGLLRALPHCSTRVHIVVAGQEVKSRHRSAVYYQRVAREVGVSDQVTFRVGHVPEDEVAQLFTAADWVALPYERSFTSQSGVLNVAARYERPVLVTAAPVLRETVQTAEIGIACEKESPSGIAAGIDRLVTLNEQGYAFPFDAYHTRYSWEENARETVATYRKLLGI